MSLSESFSEWDQLCMRVALAKAACASQAGEVPVAAVCAIDSESILSVAANAPISTCDPTAHAEINALRAAAKQQNNYRLPGVTLYVTLEPCTMCVGAIIHARIDRLVYAAHDPRTGSVASVRSLLSESSHNHQVAVASGLYAEESGELLRGFFRSRR